MWNQTLNGLRGLHDMPQPGPFTSDRDLVTRCA
jgi:hypothetical protein